YWRPRRPEEGAIDWSQPAAEVCRLVRALNANRPGAYVDVGGTRISITKAVPLTDAFRPVRGVRLQADRSHHRMGTHPAKAGSHVPGRAWTATDGLRFAAADGDVLVVEASVDGRVLTGAALTG